MEQNALLYMVEWKIVKIEKRRIDRIKHEDSEDQIK